MVLDRLEGRDRAAELLADLRVLGRLLSGLTGDTGRLRREHRPGHVGQQPAGARQHRRWRRVEADPGRTRALVQIAGTSTRTPPADFSITSTSSPAGTSSTSARWPLITTPAFPVAVPLACLTSPPSAAAPITLPSASAGSSRFCRSPGPATASTALVTTVGTNGPGARYRPICSATISVSGSPKPEPPCSSEMCSPSRPRPLNSAQKGRPRVPLGPEQAAGC